MPFLRFLCLSLVAVFGFSTSVTAADRVTVRMGEPLPRFQLLRPGTVTYLRHWIKADGSLEPIDVQAKEVRFETQDGIRRVRIVQNWVGPTRSLKLDSLFEDKTLRPITHQRDSNKDGVIKREGFRFLGDKVVGIADQPENFQKDFEIATPVPTFNFEVDLETLTVLPLVRNAEFEIVFYHPGGSAPAPYLFKVIGEENLSLAGMPIECWVIATDYNREGTPVSRFWVAKDSQMVVRAHYPLQDGSAVVKVLLPAASS